MRGTSTLAVIPFFLVACGGGDDGGYTPDPPPVAHDDQIAIDEDAPLLVATLSANDETTSPSSARVNVIGKPQHGVIDTGGTTYTPDPGFHGTDTFTYKLYADGHYSNVATVTVDVKSDGVPYERAQPLDDTQVSDLASGDIDGDGRIDLVVADEQSSNVVILANRTVAAGTYKVDAVRFEGGHSPVALAVADFDGDGRLDIVTASKADGLVVLRNLTVPGGALAFDAPIYVPAGNAVGVVAADLDGDGRTDLASIDDTGGHLHIRLNASPSGGGAIAFGAQTSFATPKGPFQLQAVDADGMGGMDLVVLSETTFQVDSGTFSLFVNATALGDLVPSFAARVDRATGQNPTSIFVADLDGDARPEIGVIDDGLWIYANQSAAGGMPSYQAARVLDIDPTATLVAPADLDGTGNVDLVIGSRQFYPFSILLNRFTPGAGFAFDARDGIVGDGAHVRIQPARPTAIRFVELDGHPPAEVVVGGQGGTLVLFGD